MLHGYKKSRYNIYDNLEFLGLNLYEQKHFCFGEGPGGPGGPGGDAPSGEFGGGIPGSDPDKDQDDETDLSSADPSRGRSEVDLGPMADFLDPFVQGVLAGQLDHLGNIIDPEISVPKLRKPKLLPKPPKMYTSPLLQDPVRMLPKMDNLVDRETAKELSKNYLTMLTEAGLEAKAEGKEGLADQIQDELDKGLLADYYQNYDLMNQLEKVGYKTFGTGYRGQYEARTGTNNQSLTRDQYDPSTITGADTSERSANLSLFNQFAMENPNMTAMEAMEAFNAQFGPNSAISAVDLGMLGYSPNSAVGPQAKSNEAERERGLYQGLGLVAKGAVLGPTAVLSDLMLSGKTDEPDSIFGILTEELDKQTGIPSAIESFYDQFTTDLGKARDAVVDAVETNIVDPVSEFFSPEPDAPEQAGISNFGRAEDAFFDPADIGNPYAGLSTPELEAQLAFEDYQRDIDFEKETDIPGLEVDVQQVPGSLDNMISSLPPSSPEDDLLAEALEYQNAPYFDSVMNQRVEEPGSFFTGLDPKETQSYIDRVTTPEGVELVRKRRVQAAPPPPTVSEQVSPTRTGNFFPGSFDRRTATPRTKTQTLADIYGFSEEDANRMLGIA